MKFKRKVSWRAQLGAYHLTLESNVQAALGGSVGRWGGRGKQRRACPPARPPPPLYPKNECDERGRERRLGRGGGSMELAGRQASKQAGRARRARDTTEQVLGRQSERTSPLANSVPSLRPRRTCALIARSFARSRPQVGKHERTRCQGLMRQRRGE